MRCCDVVATGTGRDPIWAKRVIGLGILLAQISFKCVLLRVIRWPRDLHLHVGTLLHAGARGIDGIDGDDCEDGWLSFWLLGGSTGHLLGLFSGMWRGPASGW